MTLGSRRCDVIMGYPQGDELVRAPIPIYRSTYALVFKPGTGLDGIETIADPRLQGEEARRRGRNPAGHQHGPGRPDGHVKPYQLMVDTRVSNPAQKMIEDAAAGVIDAAALWGPIAGYYAAKTQPPLTVVPLTKEKVGHMTYRITMGVRPSDEQWKRQLNKVISENQKGDRSHTAGILSACRCSMSGTRRSRIE